MAGQQICFDFEFIEDGKTIDPVSVGLVRGDGEVYYAEFLEADLSKADSWVIDNVLPKLEGPAKPRAQIAQEIIEFVGENPVFWGYYADYDWVVLCQLYGRMADLPQTWPMYCRDLKQLVDEHDIQLEQPNSYEEEHNALADALWIARSLDYASSVILFNATSY